jgi:hypothetical protein
MKTAEGDQRERDGYNKRRVKHATVSTGARQIDTANSTYGLV